MQEVNTTPDVSIHLSVSASDPSKLVEAIQQLAGSFGEAVNKPVVKATTPVAENDDAPVAEEVPEEEKKAAPKPRRTRKAKAEPEAEKPKKDEVEPDMPIEELQKVLGDKVEEFRTAGVTDEEFLPKLKAAMAEAQAGAVKVTQFTPANRAKAAELIKAIDVGGDAGDLLG